MDQTFFAEVGIYRCPCTSCDKTFRALWDLANHLRSTLKPKHATGPQAARFYKSCENPLDGVWSVQWFAELLLQAPREGWSGQELPGTLTN